MQFKINIIDDEKNLNDLVRTYLEKEGYKTITASDGEEAVDLALSQKPDLILLDIMLPKVDGFTICEMIRKNSNVPIIILTALTDEESQLKGFDKLADDYITKPFSMPIVLKHIEAIFRRTDNNNETSNILKYKNMILNTENYEVYVDNQKVSLTYREFEILKIFLENQGKVFSRDNILNSIWNYDYFGDARTIDTHVKKLRSKMGSKGEYIKTIWGMGYKFEVEG